ncbi:hypothetical protein K4K48_008005 [Colletotrichum sp. SAR 10_66]|nr:hypothetical protein K4K48_008005 [Colletotrichum sp. SAR 10_66]
MATPADFFNPFAKAAHSETSLRSVIDIAKLPKTGGVFFQKARVSSPLQINGKDRDRYLVSGRPYRLTIKGQGTIAVKTTAKTFVRFEVTLNESSLGASALHLNITSRDVSLYTKDRNGDEKTIFHESQSDPSRDIALNAEYETIYWLSIDSNNGVLKYGKHLANKKMTLIEACLKREDAHGRLVWSKPEEHSWIKDLSYITWASDSDQATTLEDSVENPRSGQAVIDPLPVVIDSAPFVHSSDQISLDDIAKGAYTLPGSLPQACQVLYDSVAGARIVLNDKDFPDFSEAIEYNCTTPGLWAYEKLKEKKGEFGGEKETYLRITLGLNMVLHGTIRCTWYNTLGYLPAKNGTEKLDEEVVRDAPIEVGTADLDEGSIADHS